MYFQYSVPDKFKWFPEARYGMFIHWGPYAQYGHGEQALFRDHLDPVKYERRACLWNPKSFEPREWAKTAKAAGMKYACLTTRHHDGYCLWDSAYTDYTSAKQAPHRDFVREFVDAFRAEGIRIGFYYSWCDFRIPAYYRGPQLDPDGWEAMRTYIHSQVEELLTKYGKVDYFFFDGVWPRCAEDLQSRELVGKMRKLQPDIIINNRLGIDGPVDLPHMDGGAGAGEGGSSGDFGTPERTITPEDRLWESCLISNWRWWGYAKGERWISSEQILDSLCACASRGGNLILNVGPDGEGRFPAEFNERVSAVGEWLKTNGEAVYGNEGGELTEFSTWGYQTIKGNCLYLILRFWHGEPELRLPDIISKPVKAELLSEGKDISVSQRNGALILSGFPQKVDSELFPVIKIEFEEKPMTNLWGAQRLWEGDPLRIAEWASRRKSGFNVCPADAKDDLE